MYACSVCCKQYLHIQDVYYSHGWCCSFHKHASYVCSPPHPPSSPFYPPPPRLTNVQFDAAYFISLSPNTGSWLTWSLAGEVATPRLPRLHFFSLFFFCCPPPFFPSSPPPVFVVAAAVEHALHWRSEALCLISSRQTDLWGFIDSKLHRGRHRAGSMERQSERGGRVLGKARIGREEGEEGGRVQRQTERQTDGRKDGGGRVSTWWNRKQVEREAGRKKGINTRRENTHPEFSLI